MVDLNKLREDNGLAAEFLESRKDTVDSLLKDITASKGKLDNLRITYNAVKDLFLVNGLKCNTFNCVLAYCIATKEM